MSFSVELSKLSPDERSDIPNTYRFLGKKDIFNPIPKSYNTFAVSVSDNLVHLPIGVWNLYYEEFPHNEEDYTHTDLEFVRDLHTSDTDDKSRDQDVVTQMAMSKLLTQHSVFISCNTGYGKTCCAIYLMCQLKLKTVILCHSKIVRGQWPEEIEFFTGQKGRCQIVKGKKLKPDFDVYILGILKAANMPRECWADIGLVIVDEAHMATATMFTKTAFRFQPMYLIGLSATYDRKADGLEKIMVPFFGPPIEYIERMEIKDFTVVKYLTNYTVDLEPCERFMIVNGKRVTDWVTIQGLIELNPDRHQEIADIAISHPDEKIIIITFRKGSTIGIYECLSRDGESVDMLVDNDDINDWDRSKRILVCGRGKGGAGLNDPSLTMLILATSVRDPRQIEGRIRRDKNMVIDIVDNDTIFEKHWRSREQWYLRRGAVIEEGGPRKSVVKTQRRAIKPRKKKRASRRRLPRNV